MQKNIDASSKEDKTKQGIEPKDNNLNLITLNQDVILV